MLAGRPAFPGGNAPEIFAAILEREPDWRSLPDGTPQPIVDLLITSLQKDQKARVRDMSAVREAIADAVTRAPGLRRGSSRFGPARAAAAMVGAAVIVVGALAVRPFLTRETGVAQTPASSSSIAVLPFVNVTGVEDNEYLADGLAQELTSLLAKQTGLRVVSRTSAFAFKGRNLDVREIARQLNVGSIVEGTLHQAGNRLRVAVQLTDATNGFQLWSETFEHDAADVLAVDREISRAIVGRLIPPSQVVTGSAMPPTTDGEAYDLFLRGQYAMAQRSKEGLTEAEGHFREAVRRDPEFGAAWAGLAETIIPLHEIYQVRKQDEAYALVTDFVRRALTARAPALSEGHAAFAHVLVHQYRWRVAVEEASLAIAANPGSAIGHEWLGYALLARGRLREAEEALRRAIDLDPLTGVYSYLLAVCLLSDGRAEEALRAAERGVQLGSSISIMPGVLARVQLGRPEEARALVNNAPKGTPWHILEGLRIYTLAASGDRTEARRQLPTHLQRLQGGDEPLPMVMPFVYVALGEPDKAVDWLRRSPDAGEFLVEYRLMPEIRDLAANPTMQEVMRQLDFSEP
jgi:TolB-like protein/tetratricopeptide (TPR) repeat protein